MIETKILDVEFDPYAFNPVFWHLKKYLEDPRIRYIFAYGGSSAAKTYEIAHLFLNKTIEEGVNCKVFRKELATAWHSVYMDFKGIAELTNEDFGYQVFSVKNHWIDFNKENIIAFGGMDDPEKAKGLSSFKYLFMNELSKFEYGDLKEIRRRMRGIAGQTLVCDWNPIDEDHWVKEFLDSITWLPLPQEIEGQEYSKLDSNSEAFINDKGNTVLIKTTYKDNFWVVGHPVNGYGRKDQEVIDEFEWMQDNAPLDYEVYGLGQWGRKKTGDEAYKDFDYKENTSPDIPYDIHKPFHISFDFNVHPYVTLLTYQAKSYDNQVNDLFQLDEICSKPPLNRTVDATKEFIKRYENHTLKKVFIYGDPTGANEDTRGANDYTLIANELTRAGWEVVSKVLSSAPPVQARIKFINALFAGHCESSLLISRKCKETIKDFTRVYENADGTKVKRKVTDKETKIQYEELGHTSDATEYFICSLLSGEFSKFKAAGDGKPIITSAPAESYDW